MPAPVFYGEKPNIFGFLLTYLYLCRLMSILIVVIVYFAVLFGISRLTSRKADNETFYRANRRAPWYMASSLCQEWCSLHR